MSKLIREASTEDWEGIWPIFQDVVKAGDTYAFDSNITKQEAETLWLKTPRHTFVVDMEGEILGTYYLKSNACGPGSHGCNCGYMVAESARGQGLARAMCDHSQKLARRLGYLAMQFNFVASTNENAVALWTKLGFKVAGRLPKAFNHPQKGFVDALVMYKWL